MIAQLLFLESEDPDKDIMMYINSPGGDVSAGLAIYDTMQSLRCDVATFCIGPGRVDGQLSARRGRAGQALRAAARARDDPPAARRLAGGQATDIEIHAREILKARDTLNELYAQHTGQPVEKIKRDTERDNFMSAGEARDYGLIDEVLTSEGQSRR